MSEQKMREALELVSTALTKCLTGGQIRAIEAGNALKLAAEALAQQPATVVELTDDEIEIACGFGALTDTELRMCRDSISAHIAKQNA